MKTKKVTISITAEQQKQAKEISNKILGRENISGLFAFWINEFINKKNDYGRDLEVSKRIRRPLRN